MDMRILPLGAIMMLGSGTLRAQTTELLWPKGAPYADGTTDSDKPSLTLFPAPADKANGAAVVVCPGGGYQHLATDKEGNAVSITTTLNGSYGSRVVVGGAGFLLNNEMDDFSIKAGTPNMYGAVGAEANAIAPGKRMLSSMTPALVLDKGKVYLVVGTPGGTTITTSVFQTLMNILEFHMSAEDAVNKPKFHHQWLPDEIEIEPAFPADTRAALKKMGYTLTQRGSIGRTELIRISGGKIEAVGDIRGDDTAEGY